MRQFKIIVEKHPEGYADVKSAIRSHIETFGQDVFDGESPVLEAFVAETGVAI